MALNAQQLIDAARFLQLERAEITCLQIQIYLLQQISGNTMNAAQLVTTATQNLQLIRDRHTAEQVIIYLLLQISGGGGGSGGLGGVSAGHYGAGNPPNFTPGTEGAIAINEDDNNLWIYRNGAWANTGISA